jgi:serine/threonine protein kinase
LSSSCDFLPFPIFEAIDIMLQIGEGVNYIHNQGIVHMDLKSKTILVKGMEGNDSKNAYVHAKIANFGLPETEAKSSKYPHMINNVETNRWMAPKIIKFIEGGEESSSMNIEIPSHPLRCDIYCFGMVCFEILTGDVPFSTIDSSKEVKKHIIQGEHPKFREDCPPILKDLIERCWSWNPKEHPSFAIICLEMKYLKYLLMRGKLQIRVIF